MKDLYSEVTQTIISALEQGAPPWICPWQNGTHLPSNLVTGKTYRGINVLILTIAASATHHADHRWLTFRQAQELGLRIRQGERGTLIVFYTLHAVEANGDADPTTHSNQRVVPLLRSYTVFNANQLESLPERMVRATAAWQALEAGEKLIADSGATFHFDGSRAIYRPDLDQIQLPPRESFPQPGDFYATALHELTHWTGHPSRLNRILAPRRELEAYAYEELVAEIGAAFLCANCHLPGRLEHASYIDSWLNALRRDKRLIFTAAGAAQKAADFVLNLVQQSDMATVRSH